MTNPARRQPNTTEAQPAHVSALDVMNTEPDPAWYMQEMGIEGPTIYQDDAPPPLRILGIGGTTSEKSWSLVPLDTALAKFEVAGADVVRATIYELDLPMFRTDWKLEQYPPTLPWLLDQIRQADAIIICSPTYHGTMSGAIKNLLDSLIFLGWDKPKYLGGKPVGLMAYGGMTSMGVLSGLTQVVRGLKGITVPTHIAIPERAVDRGSVSIIDERVLARMDEMVEEVLYFAAQLRQPHQAPNIPARGLAKVRV